MKSKHFRFGAQIGSVLLAVSLGALAQVPSRATLSGVMNDYTAQTTTTGPYEVRGPWSLKVNGKTAKADFSAALDMELSDGWALTLGAGNLDTAARGAHTHHIVMVGADVTAITGGFRINGTATVTLNGSPAPVSPTPLEVDVTGGDAVAFSNMVLIFGVPGSNHFGTEALSGVVRSVKKEK
jgi:hypothetical protein